MKKVCFAVIVLLVLGLMAPNVTKAEWFIDIYGGGAFTQDEDVTLTMLGLSMTGEMEFDDSFIFGGRIGHWFEQAPYFGLALDGSYFQPDVEEADVSVIPISALFMLRAPLLKTNEFPHGRIQPYIGVGPGLFIADFELDMSVLGVAGVDKLSDRTTEVGLDARGGLAVQLHENVAIFAEYRFTTFQAEFQDEIMGITVDIETDFTTHHAVGGISFRF